MGAGQPSRRLHGSRGDLTAERFARVLPDVTGLDREFDYLVPPALGSLDIGDVVRVVLHGRRVRGWIVDFPETPSVDAARLRPIVGRSSAGPSREILDLARWAAQRWAAARLRPFLVAGSSPVNVPERFGDTEPPADGLGGLGVADVEVIQLAPSEDPLPHVLGAIEAVAAPDGQLLVVHPSARGSEVLTERLRRAGVSAAHWPRQWSDAAAGRARVVVGTRVGAWARLARLGGAVVLDEHDEALQEEHTPTWHARDVLVERCRRWGVACTLTSPVPTVHGLALATRPLRSRPPQWPRVQVIDREETPPWQRHQLSSEVIEVLRDRERRVLCVTNTPGRSRLLACRSCRALTVCAECAATVRQLDGGELECARCGARRPPVCQACGSGALKNIRPGVRRLAEDIAAAANRPVVTVTRTEREIAEADVFVGTEAALHRLGGLDVVAFVEFDSELLAPRYRAAEQALTLLMRAARMVGRAGTVMVQTRLVDHPVVRAARRGDPRIFSDPETELRRSLGLPPFGGLARVGGADAADVADDLRQSGLLRVAADGDSLLVRAPTWEQLADGLRTGLADGARVRVEVDPAR